MIINDVYNIYKNTFELYNVPVLHCRSKFERINSRNLMYALGRLSFSITISKLPDFSPKLNINYICCILLFFVLVTNYLKHSKK